MFGSCPSSPARWRPSQKPTMVVGKELHLSTGHLRCRWLSSRPRNGCAMLQSWCIQTSELTSVSWWTCRLPTWGVSCREMPQQHTMAGPRFFFQEVGPSPDSLQRFRQGTLNCHLQHQTFLLHAESLHLHYFYGPQAVLVSPGRYHRTVDSPSTEASILHAEYSSDIRHIAGTSNAVADMLSRPCLHVVETQAARVEVGQGQGGGYAWRCKSALQVAASCHHRWYLLRHHADMCPASPTKGFVDYATMAAAQQVCAETR